MIVAASRDGVLDGLDDGALVTLTRGGTGGPAFRVLYERHRADVFALLVALLGDHALADDVTQETFFRAYRTLDRFDCKRPLRPWLSKIARNLALNELRARRKMKPGEVPERAASDRLRTEPGEVESVRLALAALPEEDRAIVVERVLLDRPPGEVAESLGVSERTVRSRVQAALERLLAALRNKPSEDHHDLR